MTVLPTKEDYSELISTLDAAARAVAGAGDAPASEEGVGEALNALQTVRTTAAMLELHGLERDCGRVEEMARAHLSSTSDTPQASAGLTAAIGCLNDRITLAMNGDQTAVMELTGAEPAPTGKCCSDLVAGAAAGLDFTRIKEAVEKLGGSLTLAEPDEEGAKFQVIFPATPMSLDLAESVFARLEPEALLQPNLGESNPRMDKVLDSLREFMVALSKGDVATVQSVLENLAEQQKQAGLYREIGGIARTLHNSINEFLTSLDPTIQRLVSSDLADSGNRLDRVLQILENSATTTIDSVELLQTRNLLNQERLSRALTIMDRLAKRQEGDVSSINETRVLLSETIMSLQQGHDNLMTVLTSQSYQDLAGQIMEKVTVLLTSMEMSLVDLIKRFGIKGEKTPAEAAPAVSQEAKSCPSLSSQTEIDSLLADFGF